MTGNECHFLDPYWSTLSFSIGFCDEGPYCRQGPQIKMLYLEKQRSIYMHVIHPAEN